MPSTIYEAEAVPDNDVAGGRKSVVVASGAEGLAWSGLGDHLYTPTSRGADKQDAAPDAAEGCDATAAACAVADTRAAPSYRRYTPADDRPRTDASACLPLALA